MHEAARVGYQQAADAYERGRPEYPSEAVQFIIDKFDLLDGKQVLDLGAGTGKFTALLPSGKSHVLAVEPVLAMREKLQAKLPNIEAVEGTAQELPALDSSIDLLTCAQSFHWFAEPAVLKEVARVLKPGGALCLIWNHRLDKEPWLKDIVAEIDRYSAGVPRYKSGIWKQAFVSSPLSELEQKEFVYIFEGTKQAIVDRAESISFIGALPFNKKQAVLERIRKILARTDEFGLEGKMTYQMRTDVYWCFKN